jgi:D-alanyl-D-alanine dipeptidase
MEKNGFVPLQTEWWHYTLKDEPYPDTYFNFVVGENEIYDNC